MALKVLTDVQELDGFSVIHMDKLREKYPERFTETGAMDHVWFETEIRPKAFIYIREDKNSIAFTIQNGPIKDVGVNGCQVDTLIHAAKKIIENFNAAVPSVYNEHVIQHLQLAIMELDARKRNREDRGVEGTGAV